MEFFFSPSLFSSLACSTRGGATMKNLTMASLFQIQRVCHKAQICHFFQITITSLIGKKLRYEQKVAYLEYALRCGLTLKPFLCGIYLLAVLIMAVLLCALCFTETSMNFHKALIDQCSVEIETFGGAFSGLYRESSINILNPPRPTHLGRVVDYCSWGK